MITHLQVKAARALLEWSQEQLAEAAQISQPTLKNFERGASVPKVSTLMSIKNALEREGIKFTEDNGVRKINNNLLTLEEKDSVVHLWDDIYDTLKTGKGNEVLIFNGSEQKLSPHLYPVLLKHLDRLKKINVTERILVQHDDVDLFADYDYYRWTKEGMYYPMPFYVYGDKVAIRLKDFDKCMIIRDTDLAHYYREKFDEIWETADIRPQQDLRHMRKIVNY